MARKLGIIFFTLIQVILFLYRPIVGDKFGYFELAESIKDYEFSFYIVKEPVYSAFLSLSNLLRNIFNLDGGVVIFFIAIVASAFTSLGISRISVKSNIVFFTLIISLLIFYEFHNLVTELLRMHLAFGVFIFFYMGKFRYKHIVAILLASGIHFVFLLILLAEMLLVIIQYKKYPILKYILLLIGIIFFFFLINLYYFEMQIIIKSMAIGDTVSTRKFAFERSVIVPLIALFTSFIYPRINLSCDIPARTFIGIAPILYLFGGEEMAIRIFTLGFIFLTIRFGILVASVPKPKLKPFFIGSYLSLVLIYTMLSPISILYQFELMQPWPGL